MVERRYRRTRQSIDRLAWVEHEKKHHSFYLQKERTFWSARLQEQAGQPQKLWLSINTILGSDRARKTKSKDNQTALDVLNFFNEKVDAVHRSTGGGPVQSSIPPTMKNFDTPTPVTVDDVKTLL